MYHVACFTVFVPEHIGKIGVFALNAAYFPTFHSAPELKSVFETLPI